MSNDFRSKQILSQTSLTLVYYCYSLWTITDHPAVKRARYEDSNNHSNHNNSNSGGGPNSSSWTLPNSPGQLSISSLSPPPFINGHSMGTTNGLSPSSSYDSFSPRGESWECVLQTYLADILSSSLLVTLSLVIVFLCLLQTSFPPSRLQSILFS